MTDDEQVEPRKKPAQERAQFTYDAIVEAAARILAESGVGGLTTNHIAKVAGVSVGSLYQYFPNKEAIVAQLVEYELDRDIRQTQDFLQSLSDAPAEAAIGQILDAMLDRAADVSPLHRELLPLVPAVDRERLVRRRVEELHQTLLAFLWERRDDLAPRFREDREKLEQSLWLVSRMAESAINTAKVERPDLLETDALRRVVLGAFQTELLGR